ncbi:MAG: DUF3108 domain-containing protein [Candidatus Latescibacter sp.]|nr:DUF3108 domain-containing protein [Candidatus Latescibacter sp.]
MNKFFPTTVLVFLAIFLVDFSNNKNISSSFPAVVPSPPPREGIAPSQTLPQPAAPSSQAMSDTLVSASSILKAREIPPDIAKKYTIGKFIPRKEKNETFDVGENLVFSIDYGFYSAGIATMSVIGSEFINGGLCYHIRTTAESNKFISSFYKVRDRVDSFIDMQGIFSRRFEKHLREGGYSFDELVDLYQDRLLAVSTKEKRAFVEIPLYVQDILSSLYYIRTFDLRVGKKETLEVLADGKVYPLQIMVHKKEKVTVEAGSFTCFLVEPLLKSEGIFSQKGRLLVWLTDDKNKIPVKMTSKVTIGNIAANLKNYKKQVDK